MQGSVARQSQNVMSPFIYAALSALRCSWASQGATKSSMLQSRSVTPAAISGLTRSVRKDTAKVEKETVEATVTADAENALLRPVVETVFLPPGTPPSARTGGCPVVLQDA